MKIILVRHTSVAVNSGTCYGQSDVALGDSFHQEAKIVREKLAKRLSEIQKNDYSEGSEAFSPTIYSSPLSRCRSLAAACGYTNPHIDARLMEMNFGDWEMQTFDTITDPQLQLWYSDWINQSPTNGESFIAMTERVRDFFKQIIPLVSTNTLIIFTHGGVIACANVILKGIAPEKAFTDPAPYGAVIEFEN